MNLRSDKSASIAFRSAAWLLAFLSLWVVFDYGQPILMPFVMAIFTSILIFPILAWLVGRRVPGPIAIFAAQLVGFMPIIAFIFVFLLTVGPVQRSLPTYQRQITGLTYKMADYVIDWLEKFDISTPRPDAKQDPKPDPKPESEVPDEAAPPPTPPPVEQAPPSSALDQRETLRLELKGRILPRLVTEGVGFAQSLLGTTTALLTNLFLVVLMTTFMLIEGRRFGEKFEEAYGKENALIISLGAIAQEVRTYVIAKTLISALTGLVVWIFLSIMEIDSAGFWGLAAFALNYIPNIGSIASAIPPILIALINYYMLGRGEWYDPWVTALGLMAIQTVIGSFMDPRLVGASLKLSPFVIVMSMLTWGLLWGPFGMILSVPIMVSMKIICSHVEGLEPIATLLKA